MADLRPGEDDPTRSMPNPPFAASGPPLLAPGEVLEERFEIVQFLARGGMGEVYEAADRGMQGKHLALKTLRPEGASDAVMRQRFEREALLAREVHHPNVCPTYDLFRAETSRGALLFLTMKLLRGEPLSARLSRLGTIPAETALAIAVQMAAALDAAHKAGVIHRDFKPGNVMLESSPGTPHVYITDFGLSRAFEADGTLAQTGRISGTLGYIAPELLQGRIAGPASDVYAFGVVLHEMLTGKRPKNKPRQAEFVRPGSLKPGLPRAWDRVILGCLAYDPACRFQSAGEALQALDSSGAASRALPVRARVPRRRIAAIAAAATAVAAGAAWIEWPHIDNLLHPLPAKRFVAVMAWPADSSPTHSLLQGVLDGITTELAHSEAADKNLLVLSPGDARQAPPKSLPEAVTALGANLVLGAALRQSSRYVLALRVYDAASGGVIRQRSVELPAANLSQLSERASSAAAQLLNVTLSQTPMREQDELARLSPAAFQRFQEGEDLLGQPNEAGLEQAIEKFQKALEMEPRFALGYASLAIAYCREFTVSRDRALLDVARKNGAMAVEYNPNSAQSIFAAALADVLSGEVEKGLAGIVKALRIDPLDPQFAYMRALALRELGKNDEAEEAYRDMIRVRPNFWPAYNDLGYMLIQQSRDIDYRKAAQVFAEAAAMAPKVALPLANEGSMFLLLHQNDDAEKAFRASLQRAPNYIAFVNLGSILFERGDYRQALDYYGKARDLRPQSHILWRNLGDCYAMLGDNSSAVESYKMAVQTASASVQTNPRPPGNWLYLAFYQAKLGHKAEAETALRTAVAKGPAGVQAQLAEAQALALLGRKEEALRLVLDCLDHGISTVDVELALDLKEVRDDVRYRRRVAQIGRK
jgi:serine/threonine protein kinase/tetratricopeptide (TPR) repeat protein